ncbi:MAG: EAL domain-containing protein, partial [Butyricicoccus sp.]|nr:EAL domain-containing protein [Butyricicoccus sp.]
LHDQNFLYAVVAMDVRNFHQIYQTFGRASGEQLLTYLHNILLSDLSPVEPVGRITRDTFCFLLKNRQEEEIRSRLQQIYDRANRFNQQRQDPYRLDLCFGIYLPQDNLETLPAMQEKAMQLLEHPGNDLRYRFSEDAVREPHSHKKELMAQLERSLQNRDFIVYLQPKIQLRDSRVVGAEALVRWQHPQRGLLSSEMFVPLLQEHHMIHRLDLLVFETVCQTLSRWMQQGWSPCPISVNLSRESLDVDNLLEPFARLCQTYGINPELIEFELAEVILLESPNRIRAVINELHAYGFQCSLDDFGKNMIPLILLRELDVDSIKLDRSFFYGENNNRRNRYIIEAILKLAALLQIRTVAKGIDNASQVLYLRQAACDMIQGFYYFHPMAIEEFEASVYQDGVLRTIESEGARMHQQNHPEPRQTSSSIVMFSYLPTEDRVTFSAGFSPVLEDQLSFENASAFFRSSDLIHENDRKDFFHLLSRSHKEDGWVRHVLRFYVAEGRYEWLEVHLHEEASSPTGSPVISGTLINMIDLKNEVDRWKEKANRDALTGLYNREYFEHCVRSYLEKDTVTTAALVFIDIDDFKNVNDSLGHLFGDDVLCCVAKRVLGVFRHTDIVARYGGDEFVVFVNGIGREDLQKRLIQLCGLFRFPYRNESVTYRIAGSVGASMFPDDGHSYQELLDRADCALYAAKKRGKDQFVLYDPELEETVSRQNV